MMTLSKEQFVKVIDKLKAANDLQNKIQDLMYEADDNIDHDFMNAASLMINHEDSVVQLLQVIMNDKDDDIPYFIYELDYGRDYIPGCYTIYGENVDISTAEKLYDLLKNNNSDT